MEMLMLTQRNPDFAAKCQALYRPQRQRVAAVVRQLFARVGRVPPMDDEVLAHMMMSLRLGAGLLHEAAGPVPLGQIVEGLFRALVVAGTPVRTASEAA